MTRSAWAIVCLLLCACTSRSQDIAPDVEHLALVLCESPDPLPLLAQENQKHKLTGRLAAMLQDEHRRRIALEESQYHRIMQKFQQALKDCQAHPEVARQWERTLVAEPTMQELLQEVSQGLQEAFRDFRPQPQQAR